jgi:hypothetical protein
VERAVGGTPGLSERTVRDEPAGDLSGWGDDKQLIPDGKFEGGADHSPEGQNLHGKSCRNKV